MSRRGWAVIFAAALAAGAQARVFSIRGGGPEHGAVTGGQPGWNRAWTAAVRINGGRGTLEALGAEFPVRDASRLLRGAYEDMGGAVWSFSGDSAAWGVALVGDRVVRWLALDVGSRRECVVFRIEQTESDFRASMKPPPGHQITALPVPPGARPVSFLMNETRGLSLEQSRAPLGVEETAVLMRSAVESQGWTPLAPEDRRHGRVSAMWFARGKETAVVQVTADPQGGSRVVRVHQGK